jgi:hypothetical protein
MMASLEICGNVFLRQGLSIAAYEGAIVAARKNATTASVQTRVNAILTSRSINGGSVTVSADPTTIAAGAQFTVTVSAPFSSNKLVPLPRFNTGTMSVQYRAVKENL